MADEKAKGLGKQIAGKIKEVAGVVTGNRKLEAEGKIKQAEGKGQEAVQEVKDELGLSSDEKKKQDEA